MRVKNLFLIIFMIKAFFLEKMHYFCVFEVRDGHLNSSCFEDKCKQTYPLHSFLIFDTAEHCEDYKNAKISWAPYCLYKCNEEDYLDLCQGVNDIMEYGSGI